MKVNSINQTNFTGYSNAMLGKLIINDHRLTYLSTKLNNNGGEKDLDKILSLRKDFGFLQKKDNNDIVTFVCLEDGINKPSFSVDGFILFDSDTLAEGLQTNTILPSAEIYCTKMFTYLGNLTKRLSEDGFLTKDAPSEKVLFECLNNFEKHFVEIPKKITLELFLASYKGNVDSKKIARCMNKRIDEAFGEYYA